MKSLLFLPLLLTLVGCASTQEMDQNGKVVGEVKDTSATHDSRHLHRLTFKDSKSGQTFKIVESPSLVKQHHETEKELLIEAKVRKTPSFLFWGGNLIVEEFSVLKEMSEAIPHSQYVEPIKDQFSTNKIRVGKDRL